MTHRVTMIIGEPGVGKSWLVKLLFDHTWGLKKIPYLTWHYQSERNSIILGRYDEMSHKYPGTDRLSMACQPHVIKLLKGAHDNQDKPLKILFEGDRLGNPSMIRQLCALGVDLLVIHLVASEDVLRDRRRADRQDQNAIFWKSRKIKISNLIRDTELLRRQGKYTLESYYHHNSSQTDAIVKRLLESRI